MHLKKLFVEDFPFHVHLSFDVARIPFLLVTGTRTSGRSALFPVCITKYKVLQSIAPYYKLLQSKTPCYKVLQSTKPVLLRTTPVLLRTTKYYTYYTVLQCTTPYYKELPTTQTYFVLHSTVLHNTTPYYKAITKYYKVVCLRTTQYY